MLKVTDRWTTQHGSWDVDPSKPYGIDKAHRDKYLAGRDIPGAGGDHHIFVFIPVSALTIEFNTSDGRNPVAFYKSAYALPKWYSVPMSKDAGYNPADSVGPWLVRIDGEKVAEGIGLPNGEHVSTFLVVEEAGSVVLPEPPSAGDSYLVINGVTVWRN